MESLNNGSKEEVPGIIANIVDEVERCIDNRDYRDVFVTAPQDPKMAIFQIPAIYLAENTNSSQSLFPADRLDEGSGEQP